VPLSLGKLPRGPRQAIARAGDLDWGIGASIGIHALLLIGVLLSPIGPDLMAPQEIPVEIEIVPAATPKPEPKPAAPRPPVLASLPPKPNALADAVPAGFVRGTKMLSAAALADPRSAKARREMATLADSERIVQLCNLEAMEQLAAWDAKLDPDYVVAYARSSEMIQGAVLKADGAVVHSKDNWYGLKFKCRLAPLHDTVTAFDFQLGAPVSAAEQEELGLPTEIEDDDGD